MKASIANSLAAAAVFRAEHGRPVLPVWWTHADGTCQCPKSASCPSPGKHPLTANGLDDATTDPAVIQAWWQRWPKANVGERTDHVPRIDIDLVDVAERLAADVGLRAGTELTRTPRGGLHIALRTPAPLPSRTLYLADGRKLGDFKASRAYVLVPPSSIGPGRYEALSSAEPTAVDDPIDWLEGLLPLFGLALAEGPPARDYEKLGGTMYEGQGRHPALVSYCGRIWIEGMAAETLTGLLQVVNQAQCRPPLPDDELAGIARHFLAKRERGHVPGRASFDSAPLTGRQEVLTALGKWLYLPDVEALDVLMATAFRPFCADFF